MIVLVCIPCLLTGGTEVQTLSLVEALVAAGHRPVVACYFEYAGAMVQRYRQAGADVRLLSETGSRPIRVKATVKHLWSGLKHIVRECKPDVAHVQYMAPGALPILILKALGVRRILATAHTAADIYSKNGLRIIRFLTNHLLNGFQCITEVAERSYFGNSHLFDGTPRKHFTIYNNIPAHISITGEHRAPKLHDEPITVGVVSRLEHIKGMDLVVPAFAGALKGNPLLRLLVVGDGSQRELMQRQVADLDVADKVEFVGRQPQSALQDFYDRIDILLMPSRSEGFGLTAIEGMARGCVPVVANVGGLPEVVTPGCGLLHEPGDAADLAAKIVEASQKINTISPAAIARAAVFSSEVYRSNIAEWYSSL